MTDFLGPVLIIGLLIVVNGLFVAAEFGIAAAPRMRIQQLADEGSSAAHWVNKTLRTPSLLNRYISTAQVGITLASLGLGMYGEHAISHWLLGPLEHFGQLGRAAAETMAWIAAVALLTYLHVVLGEMVPKTLALQHTDRTALRLARPMSFCERLFLPLTSVLNWLGDRLVRLLRIPPVKEAERLTTADELAYIVEESTVKGLLQPEEQVLLENVFDFQERTAGMIMTPRTRMVALPVTAGRAEVFAALAAEPHSRYPVYEGDRDRIIGILHVKDLARQAVAVGNISDSESATFDLRALARPAYFAPETMPLEALLRQFRRDHVQVAVVVDEFGGTAGLVTLEDLAEEIIGEIQDEFKPGLPPIQAIGPHTLRVRGDLLLDELDQHYDLDLKSDEADTVGGLIMALLGRVPRPGETAVWHGITFSVETTDGLAVRTALVTTGPSTASASLPAGKEKGGTEQASRAGQEQADERK